MPDGPHADVTERSPLLGASPEQADRAAPEGDGPAQSESANDVESNQRAGDGEDPEAEQVRTKVKSFLPILGVGIFLAFLDQSIVAAINEEIGSDLHAFRNVSWIATAYFLTMTASQPLYGKLSDVFGRKPCLLFAYTMFGIGSLGCGLTTSMEGLIAGRVSRSIGALSTTVVLSLLGNPRDWRRRHVDRCDRSAFRLYPAEGTRHISRLSQPHRSNRLHLWRSYRSVAVQARSFKTAG